MAGVELAAALIGRPQGPRLMTGSSEARGLPRCRASDPRDSTRSAARRPEISTIGTPTPGTVPMPANTRPGTPAEAFCGRSQPVWLKRWSRENGVPADRP